MRKLCLLSMKELKLPWQKRWKTLQIQNVVRVASVIQVRNKIIRISGISLGYSILSPYICNR